MVETVGISDLRADGVEIGVNESGAISVSGLEPGTPVSVHDISGRLVWSGTAGYDSTVSTDGFGHGVYMVTANGKTAKVVI